LAQIPLEPKRLLKLLHKVLVFREIGDDVCQLRLQKQNARLLRSGRKPRLVR
jgi:hypothetical protein